jgi:hypothetical protein
MFKNVNKTDVFNSKCFSYEEYYFNVIFNFLLNLRQSHYFSRINGVENVNLSPLSLFYALPNAHSFLENISLRELYWFSYSTHLKFVCLINISYVNHWHLINQNHMFKSVLHHSAASWHLKCKQFWDVSTFVYYFRRQNSNT